MTVKDIKETMKLASQLSIFHDLFDRRYYEKDCEVIRKAAGKNATMDEIIVFAMNFAYVEGWLDGFGDSLFDEEDETEP